MRAIIAIIGRGAAPVPLAIVGALAHVLSSLVMPDYAARTGPKQPVMTGKVPGDTADYGALQAAFSRGRG
jgi:hypothetical protein